MRRKRRGRIFGSHPTVNGEESEEEEEESETVNGQKVLVLFECD
jgi:hypothetical protein